MMKNFISIVLVLSLMLSATPSAFAIDSAKNPSLNVNDLDEEIQLLLDERATVLSESFLENNNTNSRLTNFETIDSKLRKCGVVFLSDEQARNLLLEIQKNSDLATDGQDNVIARVEPPDTGLNTWMTYRSTYTSNGIIYNIQRLVAQPKSSSSPLVDTGTRAISYEVNWVAGLENLLWSSAESLAGTITSASVALSIYDAIRSFISGLSKTAEVSAPDITYTWSSVTTATFIYVRLNTESDAAQQLSSISTKTETVVGYDIPKLNYTEDNGSWVLHPDVIQGKRSIPVTPPRYANIADAVDAYNAIYPCPINNEVYKIIISGPENVNVEVIWPCNPNSPLDCEW